MTIGGELRFRLLSELGVNGGLSARGIIPTKPERKRKEDARLPFWEIGGSLDAPITDTLRFRVRSEWDIMGENRFRDPRWGLDIYPNPGYG
jgi:hypothetical protein